jgi:sarcosine/dimethylglycine N-methyltransferase
MIDSHRSNVIGFFDTHPINEDEIVAKLAARGATLGSLSEDDLKDFDQDHYGGIDAVNALAEAAGIGARRVGLDHRVDFRQCDATAMPFADAAYDALISQEAWCHIPEKRSLISECIRVTRPGGVIAFTDIVSLDRMDAQEEHRLSTEMFIPRPASVDEYTRLLVEGSCSIEQRRDLSNEWVVGGFRVAARKA